MATTGNHHCMNLKQQKDCNIVQATARRQTKGDRETVVIGHYCWFHELFIYPGDKHDGNITHAGVQV